MEPIQQPPPESTPLSGKSAVVIPDYSARMTALALSFPTMELADGVKPWNALRFARWVRSAAPGHGARCAGKFLLSVWSPYTRWKACRFDLHEALGVWDPEHQAAFLAWVRAPWWP